MLKPYRILVLFCLGTFLLTESACLTAYFPRSKTTIHKPPGTDVEITANEEDDKYTPRHKETHSTKTVYKLHRKSPYRITINKEGYYPNYFTSIGMNRRALYYIGILNPINYFFMFPAAYVFKTVPIHARDIYMEEKMIPVIPKHPEKQKEVFVNSLQITQNTDYTNVKYDRYKDYRQGEVDESKAEDIPMEEEKLELKTIENKLNEELFKKEYFDTTRSLFSGLRNMAYLNGSIQEIERKVIMSRSGNQEKRDIRERVYRQVMDIEWELKSWVTHQTLFSDTITIPTGFVYYHDHLEFSRGGGYTVEVTDYLLVDTLLNEAAQKSLSLFIQKQGFQDAARSVYYFTRQKKKGWEQRSISSPQKSLKPEGAIKTSVTVKGEYRNGSGFFISPDGYLLASYDVAADADTVKVITSNRKEVQAKVVRTNPVYNLALLKVSLSQTPQLLSLQQMIDPDVGQEIHAIGTPTNRDVGQMLSQGIISGKRKIDQIEYYQLDAPISRGHRGGALITKEGSLVGIINYKMTRDDSEGIGFAIGAHQIQEALKLSLTNQ